MSRLGSACTDLISRASLVSWSSLLDIGQYWPPISWRPTPPFLVVVHLFGPQLDFRSYTCLICIHPSSSYFGGWIHRCSFYRGKSSLHMFLCARCPNQWWYASLGRGRWPRFSFIVDGLQMSLYVAPRYRSSSFIVWANLSDALGPRSKVYPSKSVNWPWKSVSDPGSGLGLFRSFLPLYFLVLESCPLLLSVRIFDTFTSGGQDGFDLTIYAPFLDISCSYVEFNFCVFCNLYGLIKTEICINSLLIFPLDI